jgi:hypothetical protein
MVPAFGEEFDFRSEDGTLRQTKFVPFHRKGGVRCGKRLRMVFLLRYFPQFSCSRQRPQQTHK